jgi:protein-S-isoprenylcysteine O-methyltransferase Ste14
VLELKVPPVALGVMAGALMWCAAWATPAIEFRFPARLVVSASLALLGAAVCLSGVVSFRRAKTTVNPMRLDATSSLVVSGIYKYTRNPMYLGFLPGLLGWAAFLSNVTALALLPAFVVYMNRFQIRPEEGALRSLFGQEYPYILSAAMVSFTPALTMENPGGEHLSHGSGGAVQEESVVGCGRARRTRCFRFFSHRVIQNPGVPEWWSGFCMAFDVLAGGFLALLLARRSGFERAL